MIGFPLDSHVTYLPDGTPVYDRAITSAPYRKLIKSLFSDGILPNPSTNLQVTASTGLSVNVFAGFALCNGCQKLQETNVVLSEFAAADTTYDRIDTVVLRLDDNDDVRECELHVIKGNPASKPVVPSLTQTNSIWEIGLANVLIKANSTQISNANITDTRYDPARCGIISSISEFDTTTLYQQIETDLAEFKEINQADFIAWFNDIKAQLSDDPAGHLQNQIGSLENLGTENKANLVEAVNELKEENVNIVERLDNGDIDTLTSIEQVVASTEPEKPVGANAVKELNDSLTVKKGSVILSDRLTTNAINLYELGELKVLNGYCYVSEETAFTAGMELFHVSEAPKDRTRIVVYTPMSNQTSIINAYIEPNGSVYINANVTMPTNTLLLIDTTYI